MNKNSSVDDLEEPEDLSIQEREDPFPTEKIKTLVSFIFLVVSFLTTTMVLSLVHERVPDQEKFGPLSDAILDIIPENYGSLDVCEILISTCTSTGISLIFIFHKHRFIVLRRVFFITGLLYIMRSITIFVTVLPVSTSQRYCAPKLNNTNIGVMIKRALYVSTGFGLSINGRHNLCGDLIYSGHTVILCMASLTISEYTPQRLYFLHWFSWIITLLGIGMILWSHAHYTIDIIVAYFMTTRVFWIYHTFANNTRFKKRLSNIYLSRVWWFPLFKYFEKNVRAPIPQKYEWPLRWPRR